MTTKKDNLEFWNSVEKTDPDMTKNVSMRGGFTAIDPMYQTKSATEKFGRYGVTWGLKNINIDYLNDGEKKLAVLIADFFTPDEGEVATANSIEYVSAKGNVDADFMKKLITNTISKELSRIGFNADVFLGKFEDDRYVQELRQEKKRGVSSNRMAGWIRDLKSVKTVQDLAKFYKEENEIGKSAELNKLVTEKKNELKNS